MTEHDVGFSSDTMKEDLRFDLLQRLNLAEWQAMPGEEWDRVRKLSQKDFLRLLISWLPEYGGVEPVG